YLGNRPLFVIGASLPNDHYSFLTVDILLPWSISQRRRLYTAPTEPISCIISEPKTCRMASISTSIFLFGEMAFYVMPDEFYRIGVLDSTLSDQGDLMELSSYAVVLASTASPSSPNIFLLVA
ncbi:unnamed protein product, partial [Brassica oleracea]